MTFNKDFKNNLANQTGKNNYFVGGLKALLDSSKGSEGFILNEEQINIVKRLNAEYDKHGRVTGDIRKSITNNRKEYQAFNNELKRQLKTGKIEMKEFGGQVVIGAEGIKGLGTAITLTAKSVATSLLYFGAMTLVIEGLVLLGKGAVKMYWELSDSIKATAKRAEESAAALKETRDEIQSINDELKTTRERIHELQSKGSLSFTEQDELKKLKAQNTELLRRLQLEKALEKRRSKKATNDAVNTLRAYEGKPVNTIDENGVHTVKELNFDEQINSYVKQIEYYNDKIKNSKSRQEIEANKDVRNGLRRQMNVMLDEFNTQFANIDESLLDANTKKYVDKVKSSVYRALYSQGTISVDEFIDFSLGEDKSRLFNDKILDMSNRAKVTIEDVKNAFNTSEISLFGDDEDAAIQRILDHINSLRNVGNIIDELSEKDSKVINNIIDDGSFDITQDSLSKVFSKDLIRKITAAGLSLKDVADYMNKVRQAAKNITIKSAVEELSGLEDKLNSLSDAYNEFKDNNGKVSSDTLSSLLETFNGINNSDGGTKALENLIKILSNTASTANEVKSALDDVVDIWLSQDTAIGELNESNKELYVNRLKQNGITNAATLVEYKLAVATLQNADASDEARKSAAEMIISLTNAGVSFTNEAIEAMNAADKLKLLNTYQEIISNSNFEGAIRSHAESLYKLALAAGSSAKKLAAYLEVVKWIDKTNNDYKKGLISEKRRDAYIDGYNQMLESLESGAKSELGSIFDTSFDTNYKPTKGTKGSGSSGKSKTAAEKRKDKYDDAKEYLDYQLERNKITYEKYYKELYKLGNKYLKGKKGNLKDWREYLKDMTKTRKEAYDKEKETLDEKLASGEVSINTYYNKMTALNKKWLKRFKSNAEDSKKATDDMFDQIVSGWNNKISDMETRMDRWTLYENWEPGKEASDYWQKMLKQLDKDYIKGLFDSTKEYYELRDNLLKKLKDAQKEVWESELDNIKEGQDAIKEYIDLVSDMMKQELEDQIDALEKQRDIYADIVEEKKKSLDLTREENEYQKELAQQNRELADLQSKAAVLALDDSREGRAKYKALVEEIRQKQEDITSKQDEHTYTATTESLDTAVTEYEDKINKQVESIQKMMDEAGPWLEKVYQRIEHTPPSKMLSDLKAHNYIHGTGVDDDVTSIVKASEGLLNQFEQNIPEILKYLSKRSEELNAALNNPSTSTEKEDLTPSTNYDKELSKKVQASATRSNPDDETNRALVDQVVGKYGSGWYDTENRVIYLGDKGDRRITAGAADIISKMQTINNKKDLSASAKLSQLKALLPELQKKWSYTDAHFSSVYTNNQGVKKYHLYKTKGTNGIQVFHDGLARGFVGGDTYTPISKAQHETFALLKNNELVFNKTDQEKLGIQLQVLSSLTDALKKMQLDSVPKDFGGGLCEINIEVNEHLEINGGDPDIEKKLDKHIDKIADKTLLSVTDAMKKRGYSTNVAANARKK